MKILTIKELNKILEEYINTSGIILLEADDNDDEEVFISPDEYKRVMNALDTWLKSNPQFKKQKYLEKGIQSTDDDAYAYIFKKVGGIKKYIIIYRQIIL